jgi:peptidyl-prolyl cis-trans isomerase B (cyclophilin B)
VASSKREKELARMRAERQAARRAAAAARRRQRNAVIASAVAVALVAVGAIVLATKVDRGGDTDTLAREPSAAPTSAAPRKTLPPGQCEYTKTQAKAAREVLFPPLTGVETAKIFTVTLTTNHGPIEIELNTPKAPCTANNFRSLVARKFYENTPCHRLTTNTIFVLQCGDPTGKGTGGPGYTFWDENLEGATYPRGTVAMANSGPDTNGSQFFLVYKDTQLEPDYTPFGRITKGLDIIEKIAAGGSTPPNDGKPKLEVKILKAKATPKRA